MEVKNTVFVLRWLQLNRPFKLLKFIRWPQIFLFVCKMMSLLSFSSRWSATAQNRLLVSLQCSARWLDLYLVIKPIGLISQLLTVPIALNRRLSLCISPQIFLWGSARFDFTIFLCFKMLRSDPLHTIVKLTFIVERVWFFYYNSCKGRVNWVFFQSGLLVYLWL